MGFGGALSFCMVCCMTQPKKTSPTKVADNNFGRGPYKAKARQLVQAHVRAIPQTNELDRKATQLRKRSKQQEQKTKNRKRIENQGQTMKRKKYVEKQRQANKHTEKQSKARSKARAAKAPLERGRDIAARGGDTCHAFLAGPRKSIAPPAIYLLRQCFCGTAWTQYETF